MDNKITKENIIDEYLVYMTDNGASGFTYVYW